MIRLFVALSLPAVVRQRLSLLCSGLSGARWQRPDQFHMTLRFIGEVDGRRARDIADALDQVIIDPFDLTIAELGVFGDKRRPQVLWAGIRPQPELDRLQGKIEMALQRVGLPPERRKFQPHVTLARLRDANAERIAAFLGRQGAFALPPFQVEGFTLFSSFLSQSGAIYRPEAEYYFSDVWDDEIEDEQDWVESDRPTAGW